jgi:hypothetical protein
MIVRIKWDNIGKSNQHDTYSLFNQYFLSLDIKMFWLFSGQMEDALVLSG